MNCLDRTSSRFGMEISAEKTKLMTNSAAAIKRKITVSGQELETVTQFKYLGAILSEEGSKTEVLARAAQTAATLAKLKPIWKDKNICLQSKLKLLHALVLSIFLYACESWTLTAELQRKIQAVEMRCFRRLLGISYTDHVTNKEVRKIISQHVKHYKDLLTTVKKKKTEMVWRCGTSQWTIKDHPLRDSSREEETRQAGEKVADNIAERTGKNFAEAQAFAYDRKGWRTLVHRSSMECPYDPGGLRDS